jgi:single-stranded DNA-binding protein
MAGINKVIIVGNLGGDPELKEIGTDKYVCKPKSEECPGSNQHRRQARHH